MDTAASGSASGLPRSRLTDIADQTVIRTGSEEDARSGPNDGEAARVEARRRRFLDRLGEFRRSRVLVPMGPSTGPDGAARAPLTVDAGGVRWLLAFTGEGALARYALARGEGGRGWPYRGVWGAALLDAAVPTVAESGMPCGVLVDVADGERGLVLPPVVGIVPEDVAVDGPEADGAIGEAGR